MAVDAAARNLSLYALAMGLIEEGDLLWAYNRVLELCGCVGPGPSWESDTDEPLDLDGTLEALVDAAVASGACADSAGSRDACAMRIMGALMPRPSEVGAVFSLLLAEEGPEAATDYLYQLSCASGYVRESAIAKNVCWTHPSAWGELEITINCSKPEKDPRDIAAAGAAPVGEAYPSCQLCIENEGYGGRVGADAHPARQNLRIAPIRLGGERWGFQYSPYAYFNEHCIAMSAEHRPMHVDRSSLTALLDFCDLFPHYFIGSNADLPIVGGSILSHDHFQGGRHIFPMMRAEEGQAFTMAGFEGIEASVVKWPISVLRLKGSARTELLDAACHVLDVWRGWDDASAGIVSQSGETPHNTITPILYRGDGCYVLDLALRCNITSDAHPLGVFHPHEDKWHVKKENIGLIEVMGLAILPPRLLAAMEAKELAREEIGEVFAGVLEDCGVFKWDEAGRLALKRFIDAL